MAAILSSAYGATLASHEQFDDDDTVASSGAVSSVCACRFNFAAAAALFALTAAAVFSSGFHSGSAAGARSAPQNRQQQQQQQQQQQHWHSSRVLAVVHAQQQQQQQPPPADWRRGRGGNLVKAGFWDVKSFKDWARTEPSILVALSDGDTDLDHLFHSMDHSGDGRVSVHQRPVRASRRAPSLSRLIAAARRRGA